MVCASAHAQAVTPNPQDPNVQQKLQKIHQVLEDSRRLRDLQNRGQVQGGGGRGNLVLPPVYSSGVREVFNGLQVGGAWWTNTALVQQLGLTDDQKVKIERSYENHRQKIMSSTELLNKEEAQLAKFLAADPIDRNAVLGQIDHVVQARGEMERENSVMTLEMRESLTGAQWLQLQATPSFVLGATKFYRAGIGVPPPVTAPGARGRGGRGQQ